MNVLLYFLGAGWLIAAMMIFRFVITIAEKGSDNIKNGLFVFLFIYTISIALLSWKFFF
jgi:hypothetical protein